MAAPLLREEVRNIGKLVPGKTVMLVCDVQERFRDIIHGFPSLVKTAQMMVGVAQKTGIPIVVTEQYPAKLGRTVKELSSIWEDGDPSATSTTSARSSALTADSTTDSVRVFEKTLFSMCTNECKAHLRELGCESAIICGLETHICVQQTALDLLEMGIDVHLPADCISSTRSFDRSVALSRLSSSGAFLTSAESLVFQVLRDSKHPKFRECSHMVKEHAKHISSEAHELASL